MSTPTPHDQNHDHALASYYVAYLASYYACIKWLRNYWNTLIEHSFTKMLSALMAAADVMLVKHQIQQNKMQLGTSKH